MSIGGDGGALQERVLILQQSAEASLQAESLDGIQSSPFGTQLSAQLEAAWHGEHQEDAVFTLLQELQGMLDPAGPNGERLLEQVAWELPSTLAPYARASRRCHEEVSRLLRMAAMNCSPREMFTIMIEALHSRLREGGESELPILSCIFGALLEVLRRVERRRAHFLVEAAPMLAVIVEIAADRQGPGQCEAEKESETTEALTSQSLWISRQILRDMIAFLPTISSMIASSTAEEEQKLRRFALPFSLRLMVLMGTCPSPEDGAQSSVVRARARALLRLIAHSGIRLDQLLQNSGPGVQEDEDILEFCKPSDVLFGSAVGTFWAITDASCAEALQSVPSSDPTCPETAGRDEAARPPPESLSEEQGLEAISLAASLLRDVPKDGRPRTVALLHMGLALVNSAAIQLSRLGQAGGTGAQARAPQEIAEKMHAPTEVLLETMASVPDPVLRRRCHAAIKIVIGAVIPVPAQLAAIESAIQNAEQPGLVSILLMLAKDCVATSWPTSPSTSHELQTNFPGQRLLQLIENQLRPPTGLRLPELPTDADSVMGALNLLRFLLLREAAAGTNYTGVRSTENLAKMRTKWLLPLRQIVHEAVVGFEKTEHPQRTDHSQHSVMIVLESLQSVVHRVLELVEDDISKQRTVAKLN